MDPLEQAVRDSYLAHETGEQVYIGGDGKLYTQSDIDIQEMEAKPVAQGTGTDDQLNPFAIQGEVDPMTAGEVAQRFGETMVGAAGGAAAVTAGLPRDLYGLGRGIIDAFGAEEGEKFTAFLERAVAESEAGGMVEGEVGLPGSEYLLKKAREYVNGLPIDQESKDALMSGSQYIGEWSEIPGAAVGISKTIKGLRSYVEGAPERIKQRGSGITLQSGVDPQAALDDVIVGIQQVAGRRSAAPVETDELGFAQKALEVTKNLQQKRGTAQQFLKRLTQNGVSEEEIQAIGLRERFSNPNERITRDQFEQVIRDRRIELEETIKTTEPSELGEGEIDDLRFSQGDVIEDPQEWNWRTEEYILGLQRGSDPDEYEQVIDEVARRGRYNEEEMAKLKEQIEAGDFTALPNSIQSEFEDAADDVAREMYFDNPFYRYRAMDQDYEIVGNDDIGYGVLYEGSLVDDQYHNSLGEAEIVAREHAYNQGLLSDAGDFGEAKFEEYMLPGGENYREILLRDPKTPTGGSPSHWSEDDVIGHVLVKDRVDAEGNRTLYAEEVQSDFAQSARPSTAEKRRLEINQDAIQRKKKGIENLIAQIESSDSPTEIDFAEQRIKDAQFEIDAYEARIKEINDDIATRAEKVGRTRFVKDTQQWLRPTMKRLIARAIEEGYDSVSVPPHQVVHERWNEDYGDFYRKAVPNTLLKVARQLDPKARLDYSDLVDSAFPELRDEAAKRDLRPGTKGLDRTPTIKITPAMREAYEEKGQSLFVPGAATVVAGKLVVDSMREDSKQAEQGDAQ